MMKPTKETAIEHMKDLLHAETDEQAVTNLEHLVAAYGQQSQVLANLGTLTLTVTPLGLIQYTASQGLMESLEGLTVVEQSLLDFQKHLIARKKALLDAQATKEA